jgi:hypothetical protein
MKLIAAVAAIRDVTHAVPLFLKQKIMNLRFLPGEILD